MSSCIRASSEFCGTGWTGAWVEFIERSWTRAGIIRGASHSADDGAGNGVSSYRAPGLCPAAPTWTVGAVWKLARAVGLPGAAVRDEAGDEFAQRAAAAGDVVQPSRFGFFFELMRQRAERVG